MWRDGALEYQGGHHVQLLCGGDELFPSLIEALSVARHEVWLATYIFNDDNSGQVVADALVAAAQRGVAVHVLVDGFGSKAWIPVLRDLFMGAGVQFEVFRALDRWWSWLQPQQLRRLHHKLCAVDGKVAFVGGINLIDDRFDIHHGWSDEPRLDFAVRLDGPVAERVAQVVRPLWLRAHLGRDWRQELAVLARGAQPVRSTWQLLRQLAQRPPREGEGPPPGLGRLPPVRIALVVRDNIRQRRAIERTYIQAILRAREEIDLACPYFYPGVRFRRALERAAARGVKIRLLLQGKVDYRFAALAARVQYGGWLARGIRIFEYTPAFLHAKVALVDRSWATVGSSNIDPLSLLLNLEANAVVSDERFAAELSERLEAAYAASQEVLAPPMARGWRAWLTRGFVAWVANTYLRIAGITGRY
jgi:cardiolipin synthase